MTRRQVVVGYDGSPASRLALDWALTEARVRNLPLLIAHAGFVPVPSIAGFVTLVDPSPEAMLAADSQLIADAAERARRDEPEVEIATALVPGSAAGVLLELLHGAAMAVVGNRGRGSFDELLIGSTSLHLATHASCPVVVVRAGTADQAGAHAGRVVVGVDGSPDAMAAVGFAFEEAAFRGCGLAAVSALQLPHVESDGWLTEAGVLSVSDQDAARALSESLSGCAERYPEVDVTTAVVRGEPVPVLVRASEGAQLLVVGSRGLGGFGSLLLGSVGHGVLHHARSAVAIIRPPAA